jgi:hypothetical protein
MNQGEMCSYWISVVTESNRTGVLERREKALKMRQKLGYCVNRPRGQLTAKIP